MHFSDRLVEAVQSKGNPLCVGIDPRWEMLPVGLRQPLYDGSLDSVAKAFEVFSLKVLDLVADLVPVIKPQSAFFEFCGPAGMRVLQNVLASAKQRNLITILDGKRNDIASTAAAYADASFDGVLIEGQRHSVWNADALTVNPYLGQDAIEPFITSAKRSGSGLFVLVRTSNPGSGLFQNLTCAGKPLYQVVAEAVRDWNHTQLGTAGLGDVGAVVGATHPDELKELRELLPEVWFLVPGYGAQGGKASDIASAFLPNGLGAVVNSSRGITFAFHPDDPKWETAVRSATLQTIQELNSVRK